MDAQLPSLEPALEEGNGPPILELMSLSREETSYPGEELRTDSSIRLLKIHAASGQEQEIECTLQSFDLNEEPCYHALSYTWGPPVKFFDPRDEEFPNEIRSILCNGQPFSVTPNLQDALVELRRSDFTDWLWVDSISIDQSNLKERASQVALMARIYRSTNETIAWLGKDETGAEDLQWAIDVLVPETVRRGSEYWESKVVSDPELLLIFGVDDIPGKLLRITTFLATHHLFHRAWVAQEVALSRAIHVRCGRWAFPWAEFQNVYKALMKAPWLTLMEANYAGSSDMRQFFNRAGAMMVSIDNIRECIVYVRKPIQQVLPPPQQVISKIRDLEHEYGMRTDIEVATAWMSDSLSKIRPLQSSEPRDKIYSTLGIASRFSDRVFQLIRPDYGRSAEEVYTSATATIIMNCQHLGILAHVGDIARNRPLNLPSWVVDYSQLSDTNPICGFAPHILFSLDESVAAKLPPPIRKVEGARLTLEGAALDHVDVVSVAMWDGTLNDSGYHKEFCEFLSYLPRYYANGWTLTEVLGRLLMFDTGSIGDEANHPARSSYSQAFLMTIIAMYQTRCSVSGDNLETIDRMKNATIALHGFLDDTEWQAIQDLARNCKHAQVVHFLHSVSPKVRNRRLFKTKGDIIGMGSYSTQAGDQIWFIRDCRTPLILRPKPETEDFWLVGEAYLQGFMHGEKLRNSWKVAERLRPVTIV
ncbi:hypothetical protein EPUS_06604 [Endocarpon pusillum Z07020]|uniref:Heterokaryon incompatibility domain-containing protein n=1 Tax=Endocarpon pusillum (strain Z07020 / HMAS-L-300199) TaxID=1263415 RepID=U1GR20_ENDPU|nr:uncharacterized protein EPUS_06604 [Endocarpon pusillum Z07020]ERF74426.1 hypothetical protein EPUS_06604 [Endocarpon pusillum Z07020]